MSPESTTHGRLAVGLMLMLTFVTGIADAVGYLALDRVFVGNMTGNIIVLGMGVAGGDDLPVLGPVAALLAFTFGAFASGLLLRGRPARWTVRATGILTAGALILLGAAVVMFVGDEANDTTAVGIAVAAASAMGMQAAVARAVAVRDLTTVVVTSTLTSFASDTLTGLRSGSGWSTIADRRFAALATIFLGALFGALMVAIHPGVALTVAAGATGAVAAVGHRCLR